MEAALAHECGHIATLIGDILLALVRLEFPGLRALRLYLAWRRRGSSSWELFDQAYRSVHQRLANHLAESGHPMVRASHGAVFENIAPEGSRITDMADRHGITKQSMGPFVDELEEHGYVERYPDPSDGRAKLVRLTLRLQVLTEIRTGAPKTSASWSVTGSKASGKRSKPPGPEPSIKSVCCI